MVIKSRLEYRFVEYPMKDVGVNVWYGVFQKVNDGDQSSQSDADKQTAGQHYTLVKTIKKNKPILYIEYNSKINLKIYNILKKFNYKSYYYDNKSDSMKLHNKEKIFNIIYINQKTKLLLKNDIY